MKTVTLTAAELKLIKTALKGYGTQHADLAHWPSVTKQNKVRYRKVAKAANKLLNQL